MFCYYLYIEQSTYKLKRTDISDFIRLNRDSLGRFESNWTEREIGTLLQNYERITFSELSKLLNRPIPSIRTKLRSMGLKKIWFRKAPMSKRVCYHCDSTETYIGKNGTPRWYFNTNIETGEMIGMLCNTCWMHLRNGRVSWGSDAHKRKRRDIRLGMVFPKMDSKPEKAAQNILTNNGIIFSVHPPILGQPDIFIEPNICIFIDGDYWHGNPKHYSADYILSGGMTVAERHKYDNEVTEMLNTRGYVVIRVWVSDLSEENLISKLNPYLNIK